MRTALSSLGRRTFANSARRLNDTAKPPRPVEDSTSAIAYKTKQRRAPPPLPTIDALHRQRSAEEAVTNILYNTPPPSTEPFKKHVLNCLVQNEPGVLSRVSGILAGRGFNIDSLVVCSTEIPDLSRMCIVLKGQDAVMEQARRQLEDLVPVWAVLNYTDTRVISRELLLVKVSILGPEYLEDQFLGGPSHEARPQHLRSSAPETPLSEENDESRDAEVALAQSFEHSGHTDHHAHHSSPPSASEIQEISPAEALRNKSQHLQAIALLAQQFQGKIVDVAENSVIVEVAGKTSRIEAFLQLVKPFGILESVRSGTMVMPRTPLGPTREDELADAEAHGVDASLLPPG